MIALSCLCLVLLQSPDWQEQLAQQKRLERQLCDSLRDVHNVGASLFNRGDAIGCYRQFQAALLVAKDLLSTRPDLQQLIQQGLTTAQNQSNWQQAAFTLHDTIETLRQKLRDSFDPPATPPEKLQIQPRMVTRFSPKAEQIPQKLTNFTVGGIVGRIFYRGQLLPDVQVILISADRLFPRVFIGESNRDGIYHLPMILPGEYRILLRQRPGLPVQLLPTKYEHADTTPLKLYIKPNSPPIDFFVK